MSSKKKVAPDPVPYHVWVVMKARLFALKVRSELHGDDLKKAGKLTQENRSELASLKKRCKSCDSADYALLHHCEAIAAGVIVPEKERDTVCVALKNAYRFSSDNQVTDAIVNALAALGVLKDDLPKCFDEIEEDEKEEK